MTATMKIYFYKNFRYEGRLVKLFRPQFARKLKNLIMLEIYLWFSLVEWIFHFPEFFIIMIVISDEKEGKKFFFDTNCMKMQKWKKKWFTRRGLYGGWRRIEFWSIPN